MHLSSILNGATTTTETVDTPLFSDLDELMNDALELADAEERREWEVIHQAPATDGLLDPTLNNVLGTGAAMSWVKTVPAPVTRPCGHWHG
jgi:hypothetical protein